MKHGEKIAPVAAALSGFATLACCLPTGFAGAAMAAGLSSLVASHQWWFLGGSVALLGVGLVQLHGARQTCARWPYSSLIVFCASAAVVLLIVLFPQVIAGLLADWLP